MSDTQIPGPAPEQKEQPPQQPEKTAESIPQPPTGENPPSEPETGAPAGAQGHETTQAQPEPATAPAGGSPLPPHYGALNAFFNGLSAIGPIALLIILACMTWPMFWQSGQGFYCPAELKSLTAFMHCVAQNSWLAPAGLQDGLFSLPQWPGFTMWTGIFALIPGLTASGLLLPAATWAATFLAVFAVWALAIAAGFGRKAALAAGMILLCAPVFAPLPHFMGPAALAAAFLLFALVFFCRGWMAERAWLCLPLAFVFTALAGLCGGPFHFLTPLIASFLFLIWRATFRRAQRADAVFGFILMLLILGFWLGAIMLSNGHENYLSALFAGSARFAWPFPPAWLAAIAIGLLGLLPWLLMIFGVSWLRVIGHAGTSLSASRHVNGSALCWLSLVCAICLSLFSPAFHPAAIAIACLAAVLLGKAFVNLSPAGNRFFFALAAIFLIAAGTFICLASYADTQAFVFGILPAFARIPDLGPRLLALSTLPLMGAICIAGGLLAILFVRRCRASGGLILGAIIVIALCQPARLMLVPEIAAMPGTPLLSYTAVESQVKAALVSAMPDAAPRTDDSQAEKTAPQVEEPAAPASHPEAAPAEQQPEPAEAQPETPEAATPEQAVPEAPDTERQPAAQEPAPDAASAGEATVEEQAATPDATAQEPAAEQNMAQ